MANEASRRLNTWKEIGAFFGRDERTAKRWEVERGLPVHRVPGGGRPMVYAYTHELSEWLLGAEQALDEPPPVAEAADESLQPPPDSSAPSTPTIEPAQIGPSRRRLAFRLMVAGGLAAAVLAAAGLWAFRGGVHAHAAPQDAEAVALYRKGLHDWNTRTPDGLRMAVDEFTQAIVHAPDYAQAYVGLADCYNLLREYTPMPPSEAYPRAKAAALRAIALDDTLPGGHRALAFEQFYWEWRTDVADREFRRALALDPNSATSHHWYGNFLLHQRRFDAALHEMDRAEALDPLDSAILSDRALILNVAGRGEEAVSILRQMEQTNPDYQSPHRYLADIDFERGDLSGYLAELKATARLLQDAMRAEIAEAADAGWRRGGRSGLLQAMAAVQVRDVGQGRLSPYEAARTYARMGDQSEALRYLRMAKSARDTAFLAAPVDSALASLHGSPGFRQLISL